MMKREIFFLSFLFMAASCSVNEMDYSDRRDSEVFYATIEQPGDLDTKVYVGQDLKVLWDEGDHISIFNKKDANDEYRFTGKTGDNGGSFELVKDFSEEGVSIDKVYAVYPYSSMTSIDTKGVLSVEFPSEQHFRENTFGLEANMMVSVSQDNNLQFKNVGGYLRIKLYGEGVSVSSITLKGNNGEKLAGKASVTMPLDGIPSAVLADDAADEITLVCDSPVALGSTAEESKDFWFVVPPVTFNHGFTISVTQATGGIFEKSTSNCITIGRNTLSKMSVIEFEKVLGNIVFADEKVKDKLVTAFDTNGDGELSYEEAAKVNSIEGVFGTQKNYTSFDEFQYFTGVTSVPSSMFEGWLLTSIVFPESISSIGPSLFSGCARLTSVKLSGSLQFLPDHVFYECSHLSSIEIPESVTSIGRYAFYNCTKLTSIVIPKSVTYIGASAFYNCTSLSSINISNSALTRIDESVFYSCSSLSSIIIPPSVTSIESWAFGRCTSLEYISLPESVTRIGYAAFAVCTNLLSIELPEFIMSIGGSAFEACSHISSVFIPKYVSSIGGSAFMDCSSLVSINVSTDNPIYDSRNDCNAIIETENNALVIGCRDSVIPDSVISIADGAFMYCKELSSIIIPESVTSIGISAFYGCSSLNHITIMPETPPSGSTDMFFGTNGCPIYVPSGSAYIYKSAEYWSDYADRIIGFYINPNAIDGGIDFEIFTAGGSDQLLSSGAFTQINGESYVSVTNEYARSGSLSMKMDNSDGHSENSWDIQAVTKSFPVTAGKTYRVAWYARANKQVDLQIDIRGDGDVQYRSSAYGYFPKVGTDWTYQYVDYTVELGTDLSIGFFGATEAVTYYLDDIQVFPVSNGL